MIKILSVVFTLLIFSGCEKDETKSELLIGNWCMIEESLGSNDWVESDKLTIIFSKNGNINVTYNDSQMKCESTYMYDESLSTIDSPQNCAKYKLESVDQDQLILSQQGRSEIYKYKFKRC